MEEIVPNLIQMRVAIVSTQSPTLPRPVPSTWQFIYNKRNSGTKGRSPSEHSRTHSGSPKKNERRVRHQRSTSHPSLHRSQTKTWKLTPPTHKGNPHEPHTQPLQPPPQNFKMSPPSITRNYIHSHNLKPNIPLPKLGTLFHATCINPSG